MQKPSSADSDCVFWYKQCNQVDINDRNMIEITQQMLVKLTFYVSVNTVYSNFPHGAIYMLNIKPADRDSFVKNLIDSP